MSSLPPEIMGYSQYMAPPVIGALIGYLTNRVAIKMLFRPLKPVRFIGMRLPMTPGVIPSKRYELASNMGEVVGDHLLTSEEVARGLKKEQFQKHLYNLIHSRIHGILERDLGPISEIIPERYHVYLDIGSRGITYQIKGQLRNFMLSPQFEEIITSEIDGRLNEFSRQEINTILPGERREAAYGFIEDNLHRLLQSETMEQWVDDFIHQKVYAALQQGKSLEELIPDSLQKLFIDSLEKQIPQFLNRLAELADKPEVRNRIVSGACEGVDKFIDSLGSMSDMVRGFLRMETVDEKIREYLDEKSDDISTWIQSEEVQEKIVTILRERTSDLLKKPLVQWVNAENENVVEDFCTQLKLQILALVESREVSVMFASMIKANFETHIESGSLSIQKFFDELFGKKNTENTKKWLKAEGIQLLRSPDTLQTIDTMIDSLAKKLLQKRIGRLARVIPPGVTDGISKSLLGMVSDMLAAEVPGLVQSLNIRQIVTEKINSLDLLKLERLLLSIMEEQFKYINLFGALLGFLIGCLNLVFIHGM